MPEELTLREVRVHKHKTCRRIYHPDLGRQDAPHQGAEFSSQLYKINYVKK